MASCCELSPAEHDQLQEWVAAHGTPQQVALRCRIVPRARRDAAAQAHSAIDIPFIRVDRRKRVGDFVLIDGAQRAGHQQEQRPDVTGHGRATPKSLESKFLMCLRNSASISARLALPCSKTLTDGDRSARMAAKAARSRATNSTMAKLP